MISLYTPESGYGPSTNTAAVGHLGFLPLSHLLRNQWRNFVEMLHMDSSEPLDVSPRKRFEAATLEIVISPFT